jgi:predicted DNA-binding protein
MAMTIRLSDEQQARFAARARREGVSVSWLLIHDCEAATEKAEHRLRVDELTDRIGRASAELDARLK